MADKTLRERMREAMRSALDNFGATGSAFDGFERVLADAAIDAIGDPFAALRDPSDAVLETAHIAWIRNDELVSAEAARHRLNAYPDQYDAHHRLIRAALAAAIEAAEKECLAPTEEPK